MIKLLLIGNLGKDCTVNTVNGKSVINFNVAHTEKFKDSSGNQKDKTIWVECAYWTDKTAVAPYLKKGTHVYVEGAPEVRTYQTQDGRHGASLSLRVLHVQLLGSKQSGETGTAGTGENTSSYQYSNTYNAGPAAQSQAPEDIAEPMDDLPF